MPGHHRQSNRHRTGWLGRLARWLDRQAQIEASRRHQVTSAVAPASPRRPNRRLLAASVCLAAGLGVMLYANWRWQQGRVARMLRTQAEALAAGGDWQAAALRYEHYVALVPEDSAVRIALAAAAEEAADNVGERQRAAELYQLALRETTEPRTVERCRLARLWLSLGREANAQLALEPVLAAEPDHPEARRIQALAQFRAVVSGRRQATQEVAASLGSAWELNPTDAPLALTWATWLREHETDGDPAERARQADGVLDRLVARSPTRSAAWLERHCYRLKYGLAGAERDLTRARELAPDDPAVWLASGDQALRSGDARGALVTFQQVVARLPQERRGYLGWALAAERSRDRESAIAACRQGLAALGNRDPWLELRLAECLVGTAAANEVPARLSAVENHLRQVRAQQPLAATRAWQQAIQLVRGRWHLAREEFAPAGEIFSKLFAGGDEGLAAPDLVRLRVELAYLRAVCASGQRDWPGAAEAFEDAWRLEPERVDHLLAAGKAWEQAFRWQRAAECYEQAVALASDPAPAERLLAKLQARRRPNVETTAP